MEPLWPVSTSDQLLPPSVVRYRPRSAESDHSRPGTQAYTVWLSRGLTTMRAMRSDCGSPMFCQVSPPSVER